MNNITEKLNVAILLVIKNYIVNIALHLQFQT